MLNNEFNLEIEKSTTKLSGNKLGRQIYEEQVKGKIDFDKPIRIIFPERIDFLASSFIQGFFYEIVRQIGIRGVEENVQVVAEIPNINEVVRKSLLSVEGV